MVCSKSFYQFHWLCFAEIIHIWLMERNIHTITELFFLCIVWIRLNSNDANWAEQMRLWRTTLTSLAHRRMANCWPHGWWNSNGNAPILMCLCVTDTRLVCIFSDFSCIWLPNFTNQEYSTTFVRFVAPPVLCCLCSTALSSTATAARALYIREQKDIVTTRI